MASMLPVKVLAFTGVRLLLLAVCTISLLSAGALFSLFVLQAERITDDFFAALERVRTIHANCRSLLRSHHQRAGLELMEIMSNHQEAAYERLRR